MVLIFVLCCVYCVVYTVLCVLCTVNCVLCTVFCVVCTVLCVLYIVTDVYYVVYREASFINANYSQNEASGKQTLSTNIRDTLNPKYMVNDYIHNFSSTYSSYALGNQVIN